MRLTHFDGQSLDTYLLEMGFEAEGIESEYSLKHPDNVKLLTLLLQQNEEADDGSLPVPVGFRPVFSVPAKMEVCGRCEGTGKHDHPAFSNGFTSDEMAEAGPDFQEEYMAGRYDVTCSACKGEKVQKVIDEDALLPGSAAEELAQIIGDYWQGKWEMDQEAAAERRMGC